MSEFDEYIVHGEPGQREKADAWQTAIGLQDVDGLKVTTYLLDTARRHIEGDITIDEARERINAYYETESGHDEVDEEGDKASVNIAKILSEPSFSFSLIGLTSIHLRIFDGVFKFAGPKFFPQTALEEMGFEPIGDYFLGFEIKDFTPIPDIDPCAYHLEHKGKQSTTPYFTTIDKLKNE